MTPTAAAPADSTGSDPTVPDDALIIIPVRNMVVFPGTVFPVTLGRETSVAAAQAAVRGEKPVGLLMQRNAEDQDPASTLR